MNSTWIKRGELICILKLLEAPKEGEWKKKNTRYSYEHALPASQILPGLMEI